MKNLESIKLNKEYKRAYFQGKYKAHPLIVTYLVKNRLGRTRVGITTSKKVGKAFERNRARRVIRAAYLSLKKEGRIPDGYDFVFVARSQTPACKSTDLEKVISKHISFLTSQAGRGKKKNEKHDS